jgi:DNA polymerase-3 subunit delta'
MKFIENSANNGRAADYLDQLLAKKHIFQAMLFLGENCAAEKLALAKSLNQTLNCKHNLNILKDNSSVELLKPACGVCDSCRWLLKNEHPQTPLILGDLDQEKLTSIKIADVKTLQNELALSSAAYRMILIPKASSEILTKESANALLKSIEEPYPNTIFILFAESKQSVLSTITSRCQQLKVLPAVLDNETVDQNATDIDSASLTNESQLTSILDNAKHRYQLETASVNFNYYSNFTEISEILDELTFKNSLDIKLTAIMAAEELAKLDKDTIILWLNEQYLFVGKQIDIIFNSHYETKSAIAFLETKLAIIEDCVSKLKSYVNTKVSLEYFLFNYLSK